MTLPNDELQAMIMEYLHYHSLHDSALALQQEWLARNQLIKSNGGQPIAPPPKPLTQKDKERMNALIVYSATIIQAHSPSRLTCDRTAAHCRVHCRLLCRVAGWPSQTQT